MYKAIILTPNDTIQVVDYINYDTINEIVDGIYECFLDTDLPTIIDTYPISLYCNEEFLIRDDPVFEKINAIASLLSQQEIRGNVAVLIRTDTDEGVDVRGFRYSTTTDENGDIEEDICESWLAEDILLRFVSRNKEMLQTLHREYDRKKSKPQIHISLEVE